jgi:Na+/proline symporter
MNSLACVCITDFIKPAFKYFKKRNLVESKAAIITKLLSLTFGIIGMLLAYFCRLLDGAVLQLALSIFGLLGGPILGVISLGMFIPFANWLGAFVGLIVSTAVNIWIGLGGILYVKSKTKPFSLDGCTNINNITTTTITSLLSNVTVVSEDKEE